MSNELVKTNQNTSVTPMTAADIRTQVNMIQEIMRSVMIEKVHFGVIPGCKQPSLYKPGAEKIAVTFRIAVKTEIENISTDKTSKWKVTASAYSPTGAFLGSSCGVCSSDEKKYKWRAPVCVEEYDEYPDNLKREVWVKDYDGPTGAKKIMQIKTDQADIDNTILQMADKRAYVSVIRKVTAASDVFTQDIEDLPEGILTAEEGNTASASPEMPKAKSTQQPKAKEEKTYNCESCDERVTEKVKMYSVSKFNKILCFNCQKKA